MTYDEWARNYPEAALALQSLFGAAEAPTHDPSLGGKSEAHAQQQVRLKVARYGAAAWRNNVGATPSKCDNCGCRVTPVRYGLANESAKLNAKIKSHDLILAIPRVIRPEDVGRTIAQFGSIEVKRPGWKFTGKGQESGQAAWAALVQKLGGFSTFSCGDVEL